MREGGKILRHLGLAAVLALAGFAIAITGFALAIPGALAQLNEMPQGQRNLACDEPHLGYEAGHP